MLNSLISFITKVLRSSDFCLKIYNSYYSLRKSVKISDIFHHKGFTESQPFIILSIHHEKMCTSLLYFFTKGLRNSDFLSVYNVKFSAIFHHKGLLDQ